MPIAKSKKVASAGESVDTKDKKTATTASKSNASASSPKFVSNEQSTTSSNHSTTTAVPTTFGFVNMDMDSSSSTTSPAFPPPSFQWPSSTAHSRISSLRNPQRAGPKRSLRRHHSLEPVQVPALHTMEDLGTVPMSANVFGGYGDHQYDSSYECSPVAPTFHNVEGSLAIPKSFQPHGMLPSPLDSNFSFGCDGGSWLSETMSSSLSSDQSSRDYQEDDVFFADPVVAQNLDHILTNPQIQESTESETENNQASHDVGSDPMLLSDETFASKAGDDDNYPSSLAISRSLPSLSIGSTPGLRFLINYYDKVISPVIVAFDGPTNPYRSHVLRLAVESETLQHAIAALSASNLRMRREHNPSSTTQPRSPLADTSHDKSVRKSSIAHSMMNDGLKNNSEVFSRPWEPSPEELHHKGESIRALNAQLADPLRRKDDSVLATLLMLCLYHICDTGVAKFKTQFAGVKKILALRGDSAESNSKEAKWLKTMFMWFDAMTATVNDREGQLQDDYADATMTEGDEWVLENLAGCDGRLFNTIAKLGRLNLLSQNKPVGHISSCSTPKAKSPGASSATAKTPDYYSMNYNRLDGNGWASFLDDDDIFAEQTDTRTQFWKEWAETRKKLQEWDFEESTSPASASSADVDVDRRDVAHISESFRYSALLYIERLAYPHLPSSNTNFQTLVAQALYHIEHVKSDVFLLWPLFITGTECVDERHRSMIRQRCLDIQKDSGFYNNISVLELLEKFWRERAYHEQDASLGFAEQSSAGNQGFKWRKTMQPLEGEYIVV